MGGGGFWRWIDLDPDDRRRCCPKCRRFFVDPHARSQHAARKHGTK